MTGLPASAFGEGKPRKHDFVLSVVDYEIRCEKCNRLLAEMAARPWQIGCPRCKLKNISKLEVEPE